MNYDDVVAAMFEPSPAGAVAAPTVGASPARRLRDAIEPIAMHSVWSRGTNERLAALGHNFMTGYVCSRAALLGAPTTGVVVSSFAVFEPTMIAGVYESAQSLCEPAALLQARDDATTESLTHTLTGEDVAPIAQALTRGVEAADGVGRPLFSGLRDLPWPESAVGQLWRASEAIREHRGDSHIATCVAAGLDAVEMNVLTELYVGMPFGSYSASRGWDDAALRGAADRLAARGLVDSDMLTERGSALRAEIEAQTDSCQQSIVDAIGDDLEVAIAKTSGWSQRCIEASAFPPNVFKRAAG